MRPVQDAVAGFRVLTCCLHAQGFVLHGGATAWGVAPGLKRFCVVTSRQRLGQALGMLRELTHG